ncbi:hypothetical protein SAMN05421862_104100 [Pseudomonas extremaustralis]|nr:hypothetical protein SAMN05421862_104100 [Pseudomonas extremaustralis]
MNFFKTSNTRSTGSLPIGFIHNLHALCFSKVSIRAAQWISVRTQAQNFDLLTSQRSAVSLDFNDEARFVDSPNRVRPLENPRSEVIVQFYCMLRNDMHSRNKQPLKHTFTIKNTIDI